MPSQMLDSYVDPFSMELVSNRAPLEDFIDPATYELGPYDILTIDTEGGSGLRMRSITVNAQGDVILPTIGAVSLRGMTIKEAQTKINKVFAKNFKHVEARLSLDSPRPVFVHINGDIPNPGQYMLPAGTRVNFILKGPLAAVPETENSTQQGKPSSLASSPNTGIEFQNLPSTHSLQTTSTSGEVIPETGPEQETSRFDQLSRDYNLRSIKIIRRDTLLHADLIAYMRAGKLTANPAIQSGDVIVVEKNNPQEPRVSISGAVNSPAEILYRSSDNIKKLIDIGGGYRADADTQEVVVMRPTLKGVQKIHLSENDRDDFSLQANDRIMIPFDTTQHQTASAWVYGEVDQPGNFPIHQGETTLQDLVDMAGGPNSEALEHGAYLIRNASEDRTVDPSISFTPTKLYRTSNQFMQGFDYLKLEQSIGTNRMPVDLSKTSELEEIKVTDGDKLYVPKDYHSVVLFGQVNNPGYYKYKPGLGYQDYINNADGMTVAAEKESIYVIKAGSRAWHKAEDATIESGDIIFVDRRPFDDFIANRNADIQKATLRTNRFNTALAAISTIASAITTYIALTR